MKNRNLSAFLMALALAVACLFPAAGAFAAGAVFTVGSAEGQPGDVVSVPITLSGNPGIMGARLTVSYSSDLELVGASNGTVMNDYVFGSKKTADPYVLSWDVSSTRQNRTANGTMATLSFRIRNSASEGVKTVSVSAGAGDVFNKDLRNVSFQTVSGAVTVNAPGPACSVTEISATLGESIAFNFYAAIDEARFTSQELAAIRLRVSFSGDTQDLVGIKVSQGEYKFTYRGITPQMMKDTVSAQLILNGEGVSEQKSTTFRDYILSVKALNPDTSTQNLCNDLLVYGGAAQQYTGYKSNDLASEGITGRQFVMPSGSFKADTSANPPVGSAYRVKSAALYYDSQNAFRFKLSLEDTDGVTVRINGQNVDLTPVSDGIYAVTTGALTPVQLLQDQTVTIYINGNSVASVTYKGVYSAAVSFGNAGTPYSTLVRALYNYAGSAAAYAAAH